MPLIEILPSTHPTRPSQPGWAYVAEAPVAATQLPPSRKRGRDGALLVSAAKQQKAIDQRLKDLERENYKDVVVAIPKDRSRDLGSGGGDAPNNTTKGGSGKVGGKMTANVRRILGYNRNFGHYLADEEALIAAGGGGGSVVAASSAGVGPNATVSVVSSTNPGRAERRVLDREKRNTTNTISTTTTPNATATPTPAKGRPNANTKASLPPPSLSKSSISTPVKPSPQETERDTDVQMTSPTAVKSRPTTDPSPSTTLPTTALHPLLQTPSLPPTPSSRVLHQLISEPPLSYTAARAKPLDSNTKVPARHFCAACGYWGKIQCRRCGERMCGLMECWRGHEAGGCGFGG